MNTSFRLWPAANAALACLITASSTPPASAETAEQRREIVITVSGDASLGSYEAGLLYFTSEVFKRLTPDRRIHMVTGSSSGSVNAVVAALQSCAPSIASPHDDLGFRIWSNLGLRTLHVPGQVTATALFDRHAISEAAKPLAEIWAAGLPADCDVLLGTTVTRRIPRALDNSAGIALFRDAEQLVIRIQGNGLGRPPTVDNYVDPQQPVPRLRLPFTPLDSLQNFSQIRDAVIASAAFPIGFPTQELQYCIDPSGTTPPARCEVRDTEVAAFFDGGVFDNTPLRLAYDVASHGLQTGPDGRLGWKASGHPTSDGKGSSDDFTAIYLNPDNTVFPQAPVLPPQTPDTLFSEAELLLTNFIRSARGRELTGLLRERPAIGPQIHAVQRRYPSVSSHLSNFFGFFEADFRKFDYYLGMYDAYREFLVDDRGWATDERRPVQGPAAKDEAALMLTRFIGADPAVMPEAWRPLACMVSVYDNVQNLRGACDGEDLNNLRILIQVSLDRIYLACASLDAQTRPASAAHHHCAAAATGASAPRLFALPPPPAQRATEWASTNIVGSLDLMAAYGFHYRDLGLDPDEGDQAGTRIRRQLLGLIEEAAELQPETDRAVILTGGRFVANQLKYEPPERWLYLTVGTHLEAGYPFAISERAPWFRLSGAIGIAGVLDRLGDSSAPVSFFAGFGPEFELLPLSSSAAQLMIGVRAAYSFSSADNFHTAPCTAVNTGRDKRECSQFGINSYLAVAFIERLRFQLSVNAYPIHQDWDDRWIAVDIGFGVHLF